jgi:L-threonylcarbamoyladenylate synthase
MQTTIGTDISHAASLLKQNEVVGIPTETVYGLAGNALSAEAIQKIYEAKNRPSFNPLIMHCHSLEQAKQYAVWNELAEILYLNFCPGPLTFLLPKTPLVPELLTAGSQQVAVRFPKHSMARALLQQISFPLAAPSANPSGYISPVTARQVQQHLAGKIPYVLDGGTCTEGLESTIVQVQGNNIEILRSGTITAEQLAVYGEVSLVNGNAEKPATPGQLLSHYAPKTPLLVGNVAQLLEEHRSKNIAVLSLSSQFAGVYNHQLSPQGNLAEAAANVFNALHSLEAMQFDLILVEPIPEEGIGIAIMDRLKRAQH